MAAREREHQVVQRKGKERDMYTCQICGSTGQVEGHHIIIISLEEPQVLIIL